MEPGHSVGCFRSMPREGDRYPLQPPRKFGRPMNDSRPGWLRCLPLALFSLVGCGSTSQPESFGDTPTQTATSIAATNPPSRNSDAGTSVLRGPKLVVVDGPVHQFGSMEFGSSKSHTFRLRNDGLAPLILSIGDVSCRCTSAKLSAEQLQPGQEADVQLTWKAESLQSPTEQSVEIKSNDPLQTRWTLRVRGEVTARFTWWPSTLELRSPKQSDSPQDAADATIAEGEIVLVDRDAQSLSINQSIWEDETTRHLVRLTWEPCPIPEQARRSNPKATEAKRLRVALARGFPDGPIQSSVLVQLEGTQQPTPLMVHGTIGGSIRWIAGSNFDENRKLLDLGLVSASEGKTFRLNLAVQGVAAIEPVPADPTQPVGKRPELLSIDPEGWCEVTIGEPTVRGDRKLFPVEIVVPPGSMPRSLPATSPDNAGHILLKSPWSFASEVPLHVRVRIE